MVKRCFIEDCCTGRDQENGLAIFFKVPKVQTSSRGMERDPSKNGAFGLIMLVLASF
jgi:hypothetical protein